MKRVGIQDVAREAGVSKTSVSNYLNGKNARLAESTKARIREVMEKLNYSPSLGARRLSTKTASFTLAAIIRHDLAYAFNTQFFSLVMKGIGEVCDHLGYRVLLISSPARARPDDVDYALSLGRGIVDGFLLFEVEENDAYLKAFERMGVPYICFGQPENPELTKWVATDQEGGMFRAVEHLWGHGHRHIALFPGQPKLLVTRRRVDGYRRGLETMGGTFDTSLVHYRISPTADLFPFYWQLLRDRNGPSAFIIPHTQTSAFFRALKDSGRDLGSIGLVLADFFPAGGYEGHEYTYIRNHVHQVGMRGAARLVDIVQGRLQGGPELFPTELVIGTTCGCSSPGHPPNSGGIRPFDT